MTEGTFVCLALYFVPTMIAFVRGHPSRWGIGLLNLFYRLDHRSGVVGV